MNLEKRNDILTRYERLIRCLTGKFAERYSLPYDDLLEDIYVFLIRRFDEIWDKKFNPLKASESTWVYRNIYWSLKNICIKMTKERARSPENGGSNIEPEAKPNWLGRLLSEVSEEGKFLIKTIISAPAEIAEDVTPRSFVKARKAVKDYLVDEKDWTFSKLHKTWAEVESCL